MKLIKNVCIFSSAIVLVACGSSTDNSLYYWGNYSDVVYAYYNEANELVKQEQALQELIQKAKSSGKNIAPGVYGHLGLVALKQGKRAEANAAFQQEQMLYPESTKFIQYLQSKIK